MAYRSIGRVAALLTASGLARLQPECLTAQCDDTTNIHIGAFLTTPSPPSKKRKLPHEEGVEEEEQETGDAESGTGDYDDDVEDDGSGSESIVHRGYEVRSEESEQFRPYRYIKS